MRDIRKGNCPLCNYHEVVEAVPPEYGDGNAELVAAVTADHGRGEFRVYFCRSCGYSQWFVLDPSNVPISEEHRTKLIKGIKPEVYR